MRPACAKLVVSALLPAPREAVLILRFVVSLAAALAGGGLVATLAHLWWSLAGAPQEAHRSAVLFIAAPAAGLITGALAFLRHRPAPARPARRNGPLQWAIAIVAALAVGAVMLWSDRLPLFPYIPKGALGVVR